MGFFRIRRREKLDFWQLMLKMNLGALGTRAQSPPPLPSRISNKNMVKKGEDVLYGVRGGKVMLAIFLATLL